MQTKQKEIIVNNQKDLFELYKTWTGKTFTGPFKNIVLARLVCNAFVGTNNYPLSFVFLNNETGVKIWIDCIDPQGKTIKKEPITFLYPFPYIDFSLACYKLTKNS